jgi:hypothetical protein
LFKNMERSVMDQPPLHLLLTVMLPPPTYYFIFPSCHLVILFTQRLIVVTFASEKCFGLVDIGKGGWREIQQEAEGGWYCHRYHPWDFCIPLYCSRRFYIKCLQNSDWKVLYFHFTLCEGKNWKRSST